MVKNEERLGGRLLVERRVVCCKHKQHSSRNIGREFSNVTFCHGIRSDGRTVRDTYFSVYPCEVSELPPGRNMNP